MGMYDLETKEITISEELKRKIEMICRFSCVKYELISGSVISIKNTNIAYARPHILKVKGNDYLIFENSNIVFINGYKEQIRLTDLEKYIKNN